MNYILVLPDWTRQYLNPTLLLTLAPAASEPQYLVGDEGVQADVGPLSDQLPNIVSVRLLDEVVQTLAQQPVPASGPSRPDSTPQG